MEQSSSLAYTELAGIKQTIQHLTIRTNLSNDNKEALEYLKSQEQELEKLLQ